MSIAFHLVSHGASDVTLVEANDPASGSSGACDGLIFMQSKKPGIHLELALKGLKQFETLNHTLPVPIEYWRTGGMVIIETDQEYNAMKTYARDQQALGLDVLILDRDETLEKEPALSPNISGVAWSPLDGHVNPMALTLGFALGAQKLGARIIPHTPVMDILLKNNRVMGVQTSQGRFVADIVVNACGAMAGKVAAMVGMDLPITPRRGQIAVTQAYDPVISHCMISAKYIAAKYNPELAEQAGEGFSIEQTENGNLLLGSTREFVGFDTQNSVEGLKTILKNCSTILPRIKDLHLIRAFAGLRPYTPDGLPLLGPVSPLEGFFMAAGHEGDGIAPNIELPLQAGCQIECNREKGGWVVTTNNRLETSIPGIYAAGEPTGIAGANKSLIEGQMAALSILNRTAPTLEEKRKKELVFGAFLNRLCEIPGPAWDMVHDETMICRCEEITMGNIRRAVRQGNSTAVMLKKATRSGMGMCQGRTCTPIILDILGSLTGMSPEQIGMPTARMPVKPIPINAFFTRH